MMMGVFAMKFKACGCAYLRGDRRQAGFSIQKEEKSKKYSDRLPHGAFLFSPNSLNKFGLVGWSVACAT
jgi:putative exporter of polyketide antibiotics